MGEQLQQLAVPYLITFGIALLVSVLVGPVLIPFLHKLKFGQEIREEGPSWHKKKSGTPTMGGFIFIAGVLAATLFMARDTSTLIVLICAVGFGLIGFIDDFIKVILKRNLGLTALPKAGAANRAGGRVCDNAKRAWSAAYGHYPSVCKRAG